MKFIVPQQATDATLISHSVPETDHAAWSNVTAYSLGNRVIKSHRIYESLVAGTGTNTGNDPTLAINASKWLNVGPTNRWAMLDKVVGTVTVAAAPGTMEVVLQVNAGDSVALLDIDVQTAKIEVIYDGSVVHTVESNTGDSAPITDWLEYFTNPIIPRTSIVFTNLPTYPTSLIRVTLTNTVTAPACGTLVVGTMFDMGATQWGASIGITDYSRKTADEFGVITVVERGYAKRINVKVEIDNAKVDSVVKTLSRVRAIPVVWIGADNLYESLIAYGFYKDWNVEIVYATLSYCTLQIEGMT